MRASLLLRQSASDELAHLRRDLLGDAVILRFRRFVGLYAKFNPGQLRIPAGRPGGGRWTDGSDVFLDDRTDDWSDLPIEQVSAQRARGRYTVRIGSRDVEVTGAQAIRFEAMRGQAEAAVRAVREIDRRWREPSSLTSGEVEGEILHQEARLLAANARLRELGDPVVRSEQFRQCLMRNGEWLAWREGEARAGVMTIRREDFPEVVARMTLGAREASPLTGYDGVLFRRTDETAFGIRSSRFNGVTLDLFDTSNGQIKIIGKVHQK